MSQDLESALAACETMLHQGASLEECLRHFPEHRETLEALLRMYQVFRKSWAETPPPSKEGLQRARARFLSEAARLREAEEARQSGWSRLFQGLLSLTTSRGLAVAAYVLVFFTVATTITVTAVAQGALPGEPLYPIKRHSEDVALFLDRSETLRERVDQRRFNEVETLTERAPDQEITLSGEVDRVEGLSFRVGGVPVQVPQEMRDSIPAEGTRVQVVGVPREDHILLIAAPLVQATPRSTPQAIVVIPTVTATPTATTPPTETATATRSASATATATATSTATATEPPIQVVVPAKTDTPTATVTNTATATETTEMATPTSTSTSTPVPTKTYTPQPPPRPITVRIEGCIEQLGADRWRIGNTWVQIPANRFKLERAAAVVGIGVMIRAVEKPNGNLEAEAITIYAPQVREFNGAIQEIGQEYWRVAERTVHVNDATEIIGERIVGARAQVVADEYCNGRLQARRISIIAEPEILMGKILVVAGDHWILDRSDQPDHQRISFNENTEIHGNVVVGATVQVTAIKLADESLLARSLYVLAGPPPTHTPTDVPPTATSTATEVVATVTPEIKGEQKQELIEPTPSHIPVTTTAEPPVQPSSTDDLQEVAVDATPVWHDQETEPHASVKGEALGDALKLSPTPALCPTPMVRS
jgi:hypothetical protein